MENEKIKYQNTRRIYMDREDVWNVVSNLYNILDMTGLEGVGTLGERDGTQIGEVTIEGTPVKVRLRPYDCEFWLPYAKIGARFFDVGSGITSAYCVSISNDSGADLTAQKLIGRFLDSLEKIADGAQRTAQKAETIHETIQKNEREEIPEPVAVEAKEHTPETEARERKKKRLKKKNSFYKALFFIAVILLVLAIAGGIRLGIRISRAHKSAAELEARYPAVAGSTVSYETASQIEIGMTSADVKSILSTDGFQQEDGSVVYDSAHEAGVFPEEQVRIVFTDGSVSDITYANRKLGALTGTDEGMDLNVKMKGVDSVAATVEKLECEPSMFRINAENMTVGFGFYDPYGTFYDSWTPEVSYKYNFESGDKSLNRNWNYTSAMPYVVKTLEGTPLAYQYTDMQEEIDDMNMYIKVQKLLNNPSKGDIKKALDGKLKEYDNYATLTLYKLVQEEPIATLEDGSPAYAVSVSLMDGYFKGCAYTNLRLYHKSGMLEGTQYKRITRGMTYSEVEQLMGILPSAFYYDGEYACYCYGEYIETDVLEEQFEYIVRISKKDGVVTNVYDNSGVIGGLVKSDDYEAPPSLEDLDS